MEGSPIGSAQTSLKGEVRVVAPSRTQAAIARRSAEARATVPDLEMSRDVDIKRTLDLLAERGGSLTAALVRVCALALRQCPQANGAYRDGHYELYSRINVGVTRHRPGGYITPTILDADTKSLQQLQAELQAADRGADAGTLTPPQLAGATFTLTDFTGRGADRVSPLVTPPHAAAVTAGRLRPVPVVRDGTVSPGQVVGLTLACDHRILFGVQAAAFLETVCLLLERAQL